VNYTTYIIKGKNTISMMVFREALGVLDRNLWSSDYQPFISSEQVSITVIRNLNHAEKCLQIKPLTLVNAGSLNLKPQTVDDFIQVSGRLMVALRSDTVYKLMALIVLVSSSVPYDKKSEKHYLA